MITIILLEHLGDIVACEPAFRYIREQHPDAFIIWCTKKSYSSILSNSLSIDRVLNLTCLTEWIWLSKLNFFDRSYNLHPNGRTCPICEVPLKKTTGDQAITIHNYYAYGTLLSTFSLSAGLPPLDLSPQVSIPSTVTDSVQSLKLPTNLIVLHCTSNELCRDWQAEKWEELLIRLASFLPMHVAEIGLTPLLSNESPLYIDLCGKLSIMQTAAVIKNSKLFIGIDSGPAHLAHAVGTPGVILLGRYRSFTKYIPYSGSYGNGNLATLLHHEGPVSEIAVERVYQAAIDSLRKSGCLHTELSG
ncbi:MAG: glycosyltransferase family 9 protein [Syntrophobacteraceae bacterium]